MASSPLQSEEASFHISPSLLPAMKSARNEESDIDVAYANRHIPAFLRLAYFEDLTPELKALCPSIQSAEFVGSKHFSYSCNVQLIHDGSTLTSENVKHKFVFTLQQPILVTDTPESIGMVLPQEQQEFGIREVSDIIGPGTSVRVIDVGMQQELKGWSLGDLVDYFEDEDRLAWVSGQMQQPQEQQQQQQQREGPRPRRKRKAAIRAAQKQQSSAVLNQISLEFSATPLRSKVQSPQFVRDLDWIDNAWPEEYKTTNGFYPAVQYYCLTSAAGSYTDFHIDFGGTSVWYHVLSGQKEFCLIPPTTANLKVYEEWLCSKNQAELFLPDMLPEPCEAFRIALGPRQTMIIPSGWIHAVYTTKDSLVFGGNFLHGLDVGMQIEVYKIETRTRVKEDYCFPYFIETHFCALFEWYRRIVDESREPLTMREWQDIPTLCEVTGTWFEMRRRLTASSVAGVPTLHMLIQKFLDQVKLDSWDALLRQMLDAYQGGYDKQAARVAKWVATQTRAAKVVVLPKPKIAICISSLNNESVPPKSKVAAMPAVMNTNKEQNSGTTSPQFRIRLSAKAVQDRQRSRPPPKDAPVTRPELKEGINSFPYESRAVADDDWVPNSKKAAPTLIGSSKKPKQGSQRLSTSTSTASAPPKKKAKSSTGLSVRQRLFKKLV